MEQESRKRAEVAIILITQDYTRSMLRKLFSKVLGCQYFKICPLVPTMVVRYGDTNTSKLLT